MRKIGNQYTRQWSLAQPAAPDHSLARPARLHPARAATLVGVRRFTLDTAPFKATWTPDVEPYYLLASGWQLPWYLAWQWINQGLAQAHAVSNLSDAITCTA